jgi:hypothetical protein
VSKKSKSQKVKKCHKGGGKKIIKIVKKPITKKGMVKNNKNSQIVKKSKSTKKGVVKK